MNAPKETPSALEDVRHRIDAIDDDIANLLGARFDLVQEVKAVKGLTGQGDAPALRPAREAQILRRLVRAHGHQVHARTLISLWCEIMISSTQVQAAFSVHRPTRGRSARLQDIVRLRFGTQVPVIEHVSIGDVVAAVSAAVSDLGILPAPTGEDGFAMLPASGLAALIEADDRDVRIVASLPLWADEKQTGAWIIGKSQFEPSGEDTSIFCAAAPDASQAQEPSILIDGVALPIAFAGTVEASGQSWSIYVADGFVPQSEAATASLSEYARTADIRHLGGFPNAIEFGE
jgi:chorismate mutase